MRQIGEIVFVKHCLREWTLVAMPLLEMPLKVLLIVVISVMLVMFFTAATLVSVATVSDVAVAYVIYIDSATAFAGMVLMH